MLPHIPEEYMNNYINIGNKVRSIAISFNPPSINILKAFAASTAQPAHDASSMRF
jgi:hypothetical protein